MCKCPRSFLESVNGLNGELVQPELNCCRSLIKTISVPLCRLLEMIHACLVARHFGSESV